jgi:hypothetical protein
MPPSPILPRIFPRREFDANAPAAAFAGEWSNPSNYAFTILLLLGGDVISRALAQLAGGSVTPVAFSFGTLQKPPPIPLQSNSPSSLAPELTLFRMGILRHLSNLYCCWRKQIDARSRHSLVCNKWQEWIRARQQLLGDRAHGTRLRAVDGIRSTLTDPISH